MATQTIQMLAQAGTTTFRLADTSDDSIVDTAAASVVAANLYTADFTDVPAGTYWVYALTGAIATKVDTITLAATTGTYTPGALSTQTLTLGVISATVTGGYPATLVVGDAYTLDNERPITIVIRDADGNALSELDGNAFGDGPTDLCHFFDPHDTPIIGRGIWSSGRGIAGGPSGLRSL